MNQTRSLLQAIVENARMGEDACDQLLTRTEDMNLRREIMTQRQQYGEITRDAEMQLHEMGEHPKPKGPMARMGMWMGMQMNTMTDHSASHIADLMIQGATMGIVEITRARNSYPDADAEAQGIASNMITRQQDAIERLKAFLGEQVVVK